MDTLAPTAPQEVSEGERLKRRAEIEALEAHMKSALPPEEQMPIDDMTHHHFATGVYCREMKIPAGVLVVGKLHKTEHLAVLLYGSVQITTETGTVVHHGPKLMKAPAGTKRVALAITDCSWLAFHAVGDERDVDAIESQFIAKSFDELESPKETPEIAQ